MSTLEIEIKEVKYQCSFGLGFLGECLENLNLSVYEIGEKLDKNPFKWIPVLMYESIKYPNGIEFTQKELIGFLEDDGAKGTATMAIFLDSFIKSLTKDVPKEENVVADKKPSKKK